MARPKKKGHATRIPVSVTFTPDDWDRLAAVAEDLDRPIAWVVRAATMEHIDLVEQNRKERAS